jgi:hypothetical protein
MRKLITGDEAEELEKPITMTVKTKCPGKWVLTDLETGQIYIGQAEAGPYGSWKRVLSS